MKTRFAPSPTGFLHLGSVRTALFAWLLAKHYKGEFILRIEDTDRERSLPEYTTLIIDAMNWLGLDWDQGPIYQSDRYDRYNQVIDELLVQRKAYYCTCSKERLTTMREQQTAQGLNTRYDGHCRERHLPWSHDAVVRLKVPLTGSIGFEDLLHGIQDREVSSIDDWILRRSDGHPTYNFAVVVDDYDMQITHVVRGDDHLNNTPKQVALYKLLDWPLPLFCHIPMILDEDGSRLSKRSGSANIHTYREQGFLPHALLNAIVRLGWSHGDQEVFTLEEMISAFDFDGMQRSAACFNQEKFHWIAKQTLQHTSTELVAQHALNEHFFQNKSFEEVHAIVNLFKERAKNFHEMQDQSLFLSVTPVVDKEQLKLSYPHMTKDLIEELCHFIELKDLTKENFFHELKVFAGEKNLKIKDIALPLRLILTGSLESPDLASVVALLGKKEVIGRLQFIQ